MPTFHDQETSAQDGQPVELYTFEAPTATYRLTPSEQDYTHASNVYTSTIMSRSHTEGSPVGKTRELTISLPIDHALVTQLIANGIPTRTINVTLIRVHRGATGSWQKWRGPIAGLSTDGLYARLRVPSRMESAVDVRLPLFKSDRNCQHQLYDDGCQASPLELIITSIWFAERTTVALLDAPPEGWAIGGEIVVDANNRRSIVDQSESGELLIDVPFTFTVSPTDTPVGCVVRAGCDHQSTRASRSSTTWRTSAGTR